MGASPSVEKRGSGSVPSGAASPLLCHSAVPEQWQPSSACTKHAAVMG